MHAIEQTFGQEAVFLDLLLHFHYLLTATGEASAEGHLMNRIRCYSIRVPYYFIQQLLHTLQLRGIKKTK